MHGKNVKARVYLRATITARATCRRDRRTYAWTHESADRLVKYGHTGRCDSMFFVWANFSSGLLPLVGRVLWIYIRIFIGGAWHELGLIFLSSRPLSFIYNSITINYKLLFSRIHYIAFLRQSNAAWKIEVFAGNAKMNVTKCVLKKKKKLFFVRFERENVFCIKIQCLLWARN